MIQQRSENGYGFLSPGLKTGVENGIFWTEIGSGFGDSGGTPLPRIPRSTPPPRGSATPAYNSIDERLPTVKDLPTFERIFASVSETELRSTNWARTTSKFTVHQLFGCSGVVHPADMSEPT